MVIDIKDIKEIYPQLLGFNNGWSWGRFRLRLKGKRKMLVPVRKGSHGLKSWDISNYALQDSYDFWKFYDKYGMFKP